MRIIFEGPFCRMSLTLCLCILGLSAGGARAAEKPEQADAASYVVVASVPTSVDHDWKPVIEAIVEKHQAKVITYRQSLDEVLEKLRRLFPRYTCFVARPEEASRAFVRDAHQLTRKLDADPYTDVIWGIITGYDSADALRVARHKEPLTARRLLSGTVGSPLDQYDEGMMFNELEARVMWQKEPGGEVTKKPCPTDTTKMIAEAFNDYKPQVFITSGHATERDWMIGYSYRNGFLRCKDGRVYGQDTKSARHDINSPNPKVHLAVGNCLIGNIPDRNCMALALMHSAGVYQMVGYTIPTSYGYAGWGVKDYFSELQAGRFTLAQAHYVNNLALVYELEKRGRNTEKATRAGLRGDRDVVVLYGDPAWEARMPRRELPWTQRLTENNGLYIFTITTNKTADWDNRPVIQLLPHRIKNIKLIEGQKYDPVITDNFLLVQMRDELLPMKGNRGGQIPIRGDFKKDQTFKITFKADRV